MLNNLSGKCSANTVTLMPFNSPLAYLFGFCCRPCLLIPPVCNRIQKNKMAKGIMCFAVLPLKRTHASTHESAVRSGFVWEPWRYKRSIAIHFIAMNKGLLKMKHLKCKFHAPGGRINQRRRSCWYSFASSAKAPLPGLPLYP